MKWLKYSLVMVFAVVLAGCIDINEDIVISETGSGIYATKMDLGAMIDMMQTFMGEEEMTKEGLDRVIDTTINMRDLTDSAKDMTPEQKELMKDGKMHLQLNIKEKIMNIDTRIPYKNLAQLQTLMAGQAGGAGMGMNNAFKQLFGGGDKEDGDSTAMDGPQKDPGLGDLANVYDVVVKDGVISKKLNPAKYKTLMDKPEMAQLKQQLGSAGMAGMDLNYTTTIQLPRPVKKSDNPDIVKVSNDKRTVTIKFNMMDLLDTPEKFAYNIEY